MKSKQNFVYSRFFNDSGYKEYLENATSFNRKLNDERKMRLPYIDGQTGVAQRHYNSQRLRRERMPPHLHRAPHGQIMAYPQKIWRKKTHQYLKFFLQPKRISAGLYHETEAEMHTISQVENPSLHNEDSNQSSAGAGGGIMSGPGSVSGLGKDENSQSSSKQDWAYYDDDMFEDEPQPDQSDSDYEEDYGSSKKKKGKAKGKAKGGAQKNSGASAASMGGPGGMVGMGGVGGPGPGVVGMNVGPPNVSMGGPGLTTPNKRRTHADNIPDSEKPFSCERKQSFFIGVKFLSVTLLYPRKKYSSSLFSFSLDVV